MCSGIAVEVHLKNCIFEKLQFFTADHTSLYFSQVQNCNFSIFSVFKNTTTLQICAVELQWNYIGKTAFLKDYSFLLLTILHCIFHKFKIVILAFFTVFKNTTRKTVKIKVKNCSYYKFSLFS